MRQRTLGLRQLLLVAIALLPLHMIEQLLFGLDELYELQAMAGTVVNSFRDPDRATVVLVFGVVMAVLFFCYGFMTGGIARLIAAGFFGVEFMFEGHHILKTVVRGTYFPGAVTAVAFVILGALLLASAWREFRRGPQPALDASRLGFPAYEPAKGSMWTERRDRLKSGSKASSSPTGQAGGGHDRLDA